VDAGYCITGMWADARRRCRCGWRRAGTEGALGL